MDGRRRWVLPGFVLLAAALVAVCPLGVPWRYAAVTAANAVPLAILAAQLWRRTCPDRAGWAAMLVGTVLLAVHNADNQVALAATGIPATGLFAAASLALGYLLLLAGGCLATSSYTRLDRSGVLDAAMIGLAAASLMWGVVLGPARARLGSSPATNAYEMVLVLLVTGLAGVIVRMAVVVPAVRATALHLLLAITAANLADVAFTFTEDPTSHLSAWWASALCVVALVAFAAALVHPTATRALPGERVPSGLTRWRLAFLGLALATNPVLAGVDLLLGRGPNGALLSVGSLAMVPLVVGRVDLLARRQAQAERRLRDLASHDDLTGLPNRRATIAHLGALIERTAAGASPGLVVLYLDLDDFKAVNDAYGHPLGDELLRAVAGRLRAGLRPDDLVARLGGDEFVVVVEGDPRTEATAALAAVRLALAAPVTLGSVVASGRASIGVAAAGPGDRTDPETLLGRADAAMYRAKRGRRPVDGREAGGHSAGERVAGTRPVDERGPGGAHSAGERPPGARPEASAALVPPASA